MTGRPSVLVVRPTSGGVAHVSAKVVGELRRQGRSVLDIALIESAAPAWRGVLSGLAALGRIRRAGTVHIEFGRTTAAPFWFAAVAVTLRKDVVVVAHDAPTLVDSPGAAVMPARSGWPDAIAHRIFAPLLDKPITAYVRRRAGAVAVLSDRAARVCADQGMHPVAAMRHGADDPIPGGPPSRSATVVFGGFLSPAKGLDDLLAAWRTLAPATDLRLVIAGEPSRQHAAWVRRLRTASGSRPNPPQWVDYLDDRAFHELIAGAAVVVLPYRTSNPSSGILIRAMVQGRPVVATRVPATEHLIDDGVNGRLVEPGDIGALARGIGDLIGDPAQRDRLGAAAARTAADRHTWARQVEDLDRIYALARTSASIGGPA